MKDSPTIVTMTRADKQKGQALAELIIACAVLALVLFGIVSAISFSLRSVRFATNKTLATYYAQQGLERARAARDQSWADLLSFSGANGPIGTTIFSRAVTRSNYGAFSNTEAQVVTSRVEWPDGETIHSVEADMLLTNH